MSASATPIREFVEPLGANRRKRSGGFQRDYFPVPLRTAMRVALRVLALYCADPEENKFSNQHGENAVKLFAEEVLECYVAANFKDKTGVDLARVFHRVVSLMDKGETEEAACEKVLLQLEAMEAAQ